VMDNQRAQSDTAKSGAYFLLTQARRVRVCNRVDPKYTLGASILKRHLPAQGRARMRQTRWNFPHMHELSRHPEVGLPQLLNPCDGSRC